MKIFTVPKSNAYMTGCRIVVKNVNWIVYSVFYVACRQPTPYAQQKKNHMRNSSTICSMI